MARAPLTRLAALPCGYTLEQAYQAREYCRQRDERNRELRRRLKPWLFALLALAAVAGAFLFGQAAHADTVTTTSWTFDTPDITSGSSSLITIGLDWSDGAWHSRDPGKNYGMLAFVYGATPAPAAFVSIDSQHTGDAPYIIGLAAGVGIVGGQLDETRWLLVPSVDNYRVVFNVPGSISALTLTHTAIASIVPADVNYDGVVNTFDVNLIAANWGELGPVGDANHDHLVNIFDVNAVASHWNSVTAVDEPSAFALACAGLVVLRLASVVRRPKPLEPQGGAPVTRPLPSTVG